MLNEILAHKRSELAALRVDNETAAGSAPAAKSFRAAFTGSQPGIIAEIKYASPSHGPFDVSFEPDELAEMYLRAGAAAISVLTDERFFNGSLNNLRRVSQAVSLPTLRKDFIIDPIQLRQARAAGASAVLLMVSCLGSRSLKKLIVTSRELGLTPLVEVRDRHEADRALEAGADTIGVNNRNLEDLSVDLNRGRELARHFQGIQNLLLICESGLKNRTEIEELHDQGYRGFLIGTALMSAPDPEARLRHFTGRDQ